MYQKYQKQLKTEDGDIPLKRRQDMLNMIEEKMNMKPLSFIEELGLKYQRNWNKHWINKIVILGDGKR
ncbi:hypothetical protein [Spiroplasma poulsonii]|uniref:hypothetical protein n=1 Tax=Spiroplasma poulsonii TaxID=2138 RepID=UPI001F4CD33E|nr:hypothetical protein [Spiroplasma poulsonii]UNF61885.1 hypothetical protein MNU24_08205 [Spiroplasma poulsonii]